MGIPIGAELGYGLLGSVIGTATGAGVVYLALKERLRTTFATERRVDGVEAKQVDDAARLGETRQVVFALRDRLNIMHTTITNDRERAEAEFNRIGRTLDKMADSLENLSERTSEVASSQKVIAALIERMNGFKRGPSLEKGEA